MSKTTTTTYNIPQRTFSQIRQIVSLIIEYDPKTMLSSTFTTKALAKLILDKRENNQLREKLEKIFQHTQCINGNSKNPLVNRKDIKIDVNKCLEILFDNYMKMKATLEKNQQNISTKKQSATQQRLPKIISYLYDISHEKLTQKEAKEMKQNIKSSTGLEELDKEILVALIQKNLKFQQLLSRGTKGPENVQIYSLIEFIKTISSSKDSDQFLNKQFDKLSAEGKKLVSPLKQEMNRLKTAITELTNQIVGENIKIKATKQKNEDSQYFQIRQESIDALLDEARQYKVQNQKIRNVLNQLIKTTKMSEKQLSVSWKKQKTSQIEKIRGDQKKSLLSLLDYLSNSKELGSSKKIEERRRFEETPTHRYQIQIQKLKAQKQELTSKLLQETKLSQGLCYELQQQKEKNKQIEKSNAKIIQMQRQSKQTRFPNYNQNENSPTRAINKNQIGLKQRCQALEKQQKSLTSQLNGLRGQLRTTEDALSQKQQIVNQLQKRLKENQKLNLTNVKEDTQQKNRQRQELAAKNKKIQELKQQIDSLIRQNKDLQRQLNLINEKISKNGDQDKNKDNLIISVLRQNQKINKTHINQLTKDNALLNSEIKLQHSNLQKLRTDYLQLKVKSQANSTDLVRLASIQQDYVKLQQNFANLNQLYLQTKQQFEKYKKNMAENDSKNVQKELQRLKFQLKQQQAKETRFTDTFIKENKGKDETIVNLKMQIQDMNSKLQRLTGGGELSKLKNKNSDLQRDVETLRKENQELKTKIERKEQQFMNNRLQKSN